MSNQASHLRRKPLTRQQIILAEQAFLASSALEVEDREDLCEEIARYAISAPETPVEPS